MTTLLSFRAKREILGGHCGGLLSGRRRFLAALGMMTLVACDRAAVRLDDAPLDDSVLAADVSQRDRARQDSIRRSSPGYIIDSLRPIDEEIRRFQRDLGDPPDGFSFGAASQAALVRAFVQAIERNDTTALARLVVNRKEFGYLVYPTSPNARPPYRQPPELVWLQRSAATNKGASRLLSRFGGRSLGYGGYSCPSPAVSQGDNTFLDGCFVQSTSTSGHTTSLRMFGPIVERRGRYKFLSLANGL